MGTKGMWRDGRLYYYDSARPELWPAMPGVLLYDDFIGVDTTDISTRTTGYRGSVPGTADALTIAVTAGVCGAAKLLSGTSDNDHAFILTELNWYGSRNAVMQTRLTLDSAAAVGLAIGFMDTNGNDNAGAIKLSGTTFGKNAQECAAFLYDTDATTDTLRCHAIKGNTFNAAPVDTSLVPVAGTYNVYTVELIDNGSRTDARFSVDGQVVATLTDAVTRTAALTPFISVGTRTAAAPKYALVDYITTWQKRA